MPDDQDRAHLPGEDAKKDEQPRLARAVQPFLEDHLDLIPKGALDTLERLPGPPRR